MDAAHEGGVARGQELREQLPGLVKDPARVAQCLGTLGAHSPLGHPSHAAMATASIPLIGG
jgi:hypothetical protein